MNANDFVLFLPEIVLAIFVLLFLVVDSLTYGRILKGLHHLTVLFCFALGAYCFSQVPSAGNDYAFGNLMIIDGLSLALKGFASWAIGLTLVLGSGYAKVRGIFKGELHALVLLALLGQFVIMSANNLLMVYLGIELLSLSLYAAVALQRDQVKSTEAAMKYFILGALASGFLLYGMSMVYGATGSLNHADIAFASAGAGSKSIIFVFGLVFLVAGIAFKLGVVPFHMWVPDVYQGAPTFATLLISGAPKLAAFAMMMRLLVDGMYPKASDWQGMLLIVAVLSLGLGNLAALAQTNLKRMLAYSTIAQMGFLLLAMLSAKGEAHSVAQAYAAAMFYAVAYVLTTLGTFGVIMLLSHQGLDVEHIADLKGLNQRAPGMALVMLVLMFSLAGIPPMIGFAAKLAVLQSVLATGNVVLAVYAVLISLVGAAYYIRVIKAMYFDAPDGDASAQHEGTQSTGVSHQDKAHAPVLTGSVAQASIAMPNISITADARVALGLCGLLVLVLGLLPAPLMALCEVLVQQSIAR